MSDSFDPYQQWLDIPPGEQPPHHYRLLGLPIFEADAGRIRGEADRRMQYVRTFQLGKHSRDSQRVLNELAAAKVCLLSARSKAQYDAALVEQLERRVPAAPPALPPEAPPLLPAEHEEVGTAGQVEDPPWRASSGTQAEISDPRARLRLGTGTIIGGIFVAVAALSLAIVVAGRVARYWMRSDAAAHESAVPLPAAEKTGKSKLAGKTVDVPENVVRQSDDGHVLLLPAKATLNGPSVKVSGDTITGWTGPADRAKWELLIRKPGYYRIEITYAADSQAAGNEARIEISGQRRPITFSILDTGGRDKFETYPIKVVEISPGGRYTLTVAAAESRGGSLMTLKSVRLRPAGE